MKIFSPVLALAVLVAPLAAQWLQHPTPGIPRTGDGKPNLTAPAPRTADGKPDLTGLWSGTNVVTDLEPRDVKPWAQALVQQRKEDFGKDSPRYLCLPEGPAYSTGGAFSRIVQTPAMLVILNEDLTYRQVFLDGRTLETDPNPSWMGYSVGRWDGDTLVVQSSGFNDRTWLDAGGHPHSSALHMTERYHRADFGHLEVEVKFEDPAAYSRPWTVRVRSALAADTELLQAVCNEGQSGREHWVGKISDADKSKVIVAPEILSKYIGVYKGFWGVRPRTVEVSYSGGALFVSVDGREKQALIPQSETRFSGPGLSYAFVRDDRGIATDMIEGHVSGDYKYPRQR
jgi:hypothetical protein